MKQLYSLLILLSVTAVATAEIALAAIKGLPFENYVNKVEVSR
ncbi:MAG: hypothetical protein O2945_22135 [Planctomycetota bacterium]|nr:hypothetical protein [Planctomycetota bacterium]